MHKLNAIDSYPKSYFIKLMINFLVATITIFSIFYGCAAMKLDRKISIRPISIRVVEKGTGVPISDAVVYYQIEASYLEIAFGVIPRIDPVHFKDVYIADLRTDGNGVLNISGIEVTLGQYEKVYAEIIYINIDIKSTDVERNDKPSTFFKYFNIHDAANVEKFFNPITQLKGNVIYNSVDPLDVKEMPTSRKKFNITWISEGMLNDKEYLTVELEKSGGIKDGVGEAVVPKN